MKLAVVVSRFPYPLEKGDKLRVFHQIKELSQRHEIQLHCLTDKKINSEWVSEVEQYCSELHIYQLRKGLIYFNVFKKLFGSHPFQVGYFYQRAIKKKMLQNIHSFQAEHLFAQLIRTTEYIKDIHDIPKTLDFMDALSKGMLRRAEKAKGIKKFLFKLEGKRLAEYENRIFDYFNHHCIISEQDQSFINHPQSSDIAIIKNGISSDFFETPTTSKTHDLVFVGNMNYPPNIACSEYLVHEILPLLNNTKVKLAGASPNKRIQELAKNDKVEVTGWVDDIRTSYCSAKIFVAPLFIGTGLQNKLLEAMALGIPVITTSLANNALGAEKDKEILIAETKEEFVQHINELLNNSEKYDQIVAAARSFVKENYSWQQSTQKLEKLFTS